MSKRQVKINFTLVGKSFDIKETESLVSQDILNDVTQKVKLHFGQRPILVSDADVLHRRGSYPKYFSAGWFVSDKTVDGVENGIGSELVVVSHGDTIEIAQNEMIKHMGFVDWDTLAKDIQCLDI